MNISRHALMRYTSRIREHEGITNNNWDMWRNNNKDLANKIEVALKKELEGAELITTGNYGTHRKASFYIRRDLMTTYIVNDNTMITCYKIDYGLDSKGNRDMLEVLLNNLQRAIESEEKHLLEKGASKAKLNSEIKLKNIEISELESKISKIKNEKHQLELESKDIDLQGKELNILISSAKEKIIISREAV